jgi:hypothetical protein
MAVCATSLVPLGWRVDGSAWAIIFPLAYVDSNLFEIYAANRIWFSVVTGCHILFPVRLPCLGQCEGDNLLCPIDRP